MNSLGSGKKLGFFIALAVVLLSSAFLIASGCGTPEVTSFSYAELSDPTSLDPALVNESVGVNIARYLFDGLVGYDSKTGAVKPAIAERWEVSDDATVFTFHLRKGLNFTNGREVKAGDFVYAWTRALGPQFADGMGASILSPIMGAEAFAMGEAPTVEGLDAVDDYTLKVTLEFPLAEFVTFLGHPVAAPVPREEVEKADFDFSENPVGNGPFKLKERRPNEQIVLVSNSGYYGEKAKVDEVTVKIIPNPATAVAELKAGNVDIVRTIPPGQIESLKSDGSVRFIEAQVNATSFLGFNMSMDPWQGNDRVRQALNWAIDRPAITEKILQGQATAADGIVPVSMPGHQAEAMPYRYEPEMARALLVDAGYPGGQDLPPLKLSYRMEDPSGGDVAQAVQANLKDVGVDVELEGLESGLFLDRMIGGELGLIYATWQADYNSVDTFLYPLFKSDQPQNVFRYANPDVDALLDKARATVDGDERTKAYNDTERLMLADSPVVPLAFRQDLIVYLPKVTNFAYTPLGDLALNEIAVSEK